MWLLEDILGLIFIAFFVLAFALGFIYEKTKSIIQGIKNKREKKRIDFINGFVFPERLRTHLKSAYPSLSKADVLLVEDGLRRYFILSTTAGKKNLAMPSQAVDVMWHEFILFTKQYQEFCHRAFNRFLHHTPSEAMMTPTTAQNGIRNTWFYSCEFEDITAKSPDQLPLLFALDGQLNIHDGFNYTLDRHSSSNSKEYYAGSIGCISDHSNQSSSYRSK